MTARRVLHLMTTLDRGGAENALLAMCRSFAGRADRWDVSVGFLKGAGELAPEFEAAGVEVHRLDLEGLRGVGAYGRARRLYRHVRPDLVHTHLFKADCLGAALVGSRSPGRTALVSTKHNEDAYLAGNGPRGKAVRALARRVAARADALVAISDGVARFVEAWIGPAARELRTIRYGVPEPGNGTDSARLRRAWGVPEGTTLLLCPARLAPQKDHRTLLAALRRLPAAPAVRLVLLGRGPLEAELRAAVAESGDDRVVFAGFLPDPTPALTAADVIVLSSSYEGLGLALIEAALLGKPIVATAVGGIPEVVEDGVTGILAPPADPDALATAVSRVIADRRRAAALGRAGRERAARLFCPDACLEATERLYEDTLGPRG